MARFYYYGAVILASLGIAAKGDPPSRAVVTARAIHAPRPAYPSSLKEHGIGGKGEFVMHVDQKTGIVRSVEIAKSTGVAVLDQSCVSTFKKWRFAVDTVSTVRCPVRFVPDAPPSRN